MAKKNFREQDNPVLRTNEQDEIICRMADAFPEEESPSREETIYQLLAIEEMPEEIVDLYRIFHTFAPTDGNSMVRTNNREILNGFLITDQTEEEESNMPLNATQELEKKIPGRKRVFIAKEPDKNGDIEVVMTENGSTHSFIVTGEAISGFFYAHPIYGRYNMPAVVRTISRDISDFCRESIEDTQLIQRSRCRETIKAVYISGDGSEKTWSFRSETDGFGDVIASSYGDHVRYVAFMVAFLKAAFGDATRGGVYEWLYKAICYGPAA